MCAQLWAPALTLPSADPELKQQTPQIQARPICYLKESWQVQVRLLEAAGLLSYQWAHTILSQPPLVPSTTENSKDRSGY